MSIRVMSVLERSIGEVALSEKCQTVLKDVCIRGGSTRDLEFLAFKRVLD